MSFDKINTRDRDFQAFRQLPDESIVRAVLVENASNDPIPVYLTNPGSSIGEVKSFFGQAPAVASGSETLVSSYTVPLAKTAYLVKVQFSGTNVATYNVYHNASLIAVYRTYFGSRLGDELQFACVSVEGLLLAAGDVVTLKVIHSRPFIGDFDGRIQILENA